MGKTIQLGGVAAMLISCAVSAAAEPFVSEISSPGAFALAKDRAAAPSGI